MCLVHRYKIEVGYQVKELVIEAREELKEMLGGRALQFNGAADDSLPSVERAWSVEYLFDDHSELSRCAAACLEAPTPFH